MFFECFEQDYGFWREEDPGGDHRYRHSTRFMTWCWPWPSDWGNVCQVFFTLKLPPFHAVFLGRKTVLESRKLYVHSLKVEYVHKLLRILLHGDLSILPYLFIFTFTFNYSRVDLQCCASFCCTAKWPSHAYIYILFLVWSSVMVSPKRLGIVLIMHIYVHSFSYIISYHGLSQETGYSSLCYTAGPHCLSILNVIVYIYQPQTPSLSYFLPPTLWQPQVYSLCLCESVSLLYNRLICAIF